MSESDDLARFVPGFVGVPGQRTFLLEVETGGHTSWYLLEKAQVTALAEESARLLARFGFTGSGAHIELGQVAEPRAVTFRIGSIRLAYDEPAGRIEVELTPTEDDAGTFSFFLSPAQLDAAVRTARTAIAAGRPKCPRCDLAIDPEGHVCPTTNGDLRHHRP